MAATNPFKNGFRRESCTVKEMLPGRLSPPTEPLENTPARDCLLCLYAQMSFVLLLIMELRGESPTTGRGKGLVGHHCVLCTAARIVERAGFAY